MRVKREIGLSFYQQTAESPRMSIMQVKGTNGLRPCNRVETLETREQQWVRSILSRST